ncbi:MAG: type II secretion system protein [PVC group bacterium]|nr:type II secretion system protein [PVC group bacterium]
MINKKGFTLVELLMVVIIIGILVTIAVPNYFRSIERAKGGKAKAAIDVIRKASIQYRALNDTFPPTDITELDGMEIPGNMTAATPFDDGDWQYTVSGDATTVSIVATRNAGEHSTETLTMDVDGTITNSATPNEWD